MEISSVAASVSATSLAKVQAQVSVTLLRKALDIQQANALQLLQAVPAPAPTSTGSIGTIIDTRA